MGSIEERIVQRAQKKLFLDGMVNRGSTAQGQAADDAALREAEAEEQAEMRDEKEGDDAVLDKVIKEDKASVMSFLRFGWNSVFSHKQPKIKGHNSDSSSATEVEDESDELTYEDIDLIIDRTRGSAPTTDPLPSSGDNTTTHVQPTSSSSTSSFSSSAHVLGSDINYDHGDTNDCSSNKEQRFQKLMERQEKYLNSFDELEAFVPITG